MNTIRNLFPEDVEELRRMLQTVYRAIHGYQNDRTSQLEEAMRTAVRSVMPVLERFKPNIPAYKQRYIELLNEEHRLTPYDLIICFDRAIYELHARVKAGEIANSLPWSKALRDLFNERQETATGMGIGGNGSEEVDFVTSGVSACKGKAAGIARVILDPSALSRIEPGDILVTPMTDPAFLTVAPQLSGLITDRGGVICHAAILAREFNLPCIVGCRDATVVIRDGERILMDALAGIVTRIV